MGQSNSKPGSGRRVTFAHNDGGSPRRHSSQTVGYRSDTFDSYDANPVSRESTVSLGQKIQSKAEEEGQSPPGSAQKVTRVTTVTRLRSPPLTQTTVTRQSSPLPTRTTVVRQPSPAARTTVVRQPSPAARTTVTHSPSPPLERTTTTRTTVVTEGKRSDPDLLPQPETLKIVMPGTKTQHSSRVKVVEANVKLPEEHETRTTFRGRYQYPDEEEDSEYSRRINVPKPRMSNDLWGMTSDYLAKDRDTPESDKRYITKTYEYPQHRYTRSKRPPINLNPGLDLEPHLNQGDNMNSKLVNSFAARKQYGNMIVRQHRSKWAKQRDKPANDWLYEEDDRPTYTIRAADKGQGIRVGRPAGDIIYNADDLIGVKDGDPHVFSLRDDTFIRGDDDIEETKQFQTTKHGSKPPDGTITFDSRGRPLPPMFESDNDTTINKAQKITTTIKKSEQKKTGPTKVIVKEFHQSPTPPVQVTTNNSPEFRYNTPDSGSQIYATHIRTHGPQTIGSRSVIKETGGKSPKRKETNFYVGDPVPTTVVKEIVHHHGPVDDVKVTRPQGRMKGGKVIRETVEEIYHDEDPNVRNDQLNQKLPNHKSNIRGPNAPGSYTTEIVRELNQPKGTKAGVSVKRPSVSVSSSRTSLNSSISNPRRGPTKKTIKTSSKAPPTQVIHEVVHLGGHEQVDRPIRETVRETVHIIGPPGGRPVPTESRGLEREVVREMVHVMGSDDGNRSSVRGTASEVIHREIQEAERKAQNTGREAVRETVTIGPNYKQNPKGQRQDSPRMSDNKFQQKSGLRNRPKDIVEETLYGEQPPREGSADSIHHQRYEGDVPQHHTNHTKVTETRYDDGYDDRYDRPYVEEHHHQSYRGNSPPEHYKGRETYDGDYYGSDRDFQQRGEHYDEGSYDQYGGGNGLGHQAEETVKTVRRTVFH